MSTNHDYALVVRWTPDPGGATTDPRSYRRDHEITAPGLPTILGSSDPHFRGDPSRWNPEQLFLASVSQCHLLWYLSLAAAEGVVVTEYQDEATAVMVEEVSGAGQFVSMTLHPRVTITDERHRARAEALHERAGAMCFIARSVKFPVRHVVSIVVDPGAGDGAGPTVG